MILSAVYTSKWEEGDIISQCKINAISGAIVDIEASEEGANFEHHIKDEIDVEVGDNYLTLAVDEDWIVDADAKALRSAITSALSNNSAHQAKADH